MDQLILVLGSPRTEPIQHLISNNSQRPYVALSCIILSLQKLWGHVDRAPYTGLKHLIPKVINILRKPKVSDLIHPLVYQYISWFQVSVHHFLRY